MQEEVKRYPKQDIKEQEQAQNFKQYWTEHRITLIAFETQYIYQKKSNKKNQEEEQQEQPSPKSKKKDIQHQGGFLFPGRFDERQNSLNVISEINASQCSHLKDLFNNENKIGEDMIELRQFIRIMLELKHSTIFFEFMELYDFILRQIIDVKFEGLYTEQNRANTMDKITEKITKFVENKPPFKTLKSYLLQGRKQTTKLFRVTIYCFLAEKFNFNINEYYSEAFDVIEQEKKIPQKKRKSE